MSDTAATEDNANYTQEIRKLEIKYSAIKITPVYQEVSQNEIVMAFSYDRLGKKLLMILKAYS